jgi:hypothetical protein
MHRVWSGWLTLKLRTTEVLQDLFPVRRVIEASQVRLQLATENLQRGTLADTVGPHESQYLARAGHRQPVQLEAVRRVSMRDLGLEVGGQVDNIDGVEGAFLGADTAANTQALGDEGDLGHVVDLDAQLARADHGTRLFTFLSAFLRLLVPEPCFERAYLPWACTTVANILTLAFPKFAWRGSGACTLSELTMAILQKLVQVTFALPGEP